jgi:hypothetical protein
MKIKATHARKTTHITNLRVHLAHDTNRGVFVFFTLSAPLLKRRCFSTEFSSMATKFSLSLSLSLSLFQCLPVVNSISHQTQMGKSHILYRKIVGKKTTFVEQVENTSVTDKEKQSN